jgi:hypothetical protein
MNYADHASFKLRDDATLRETVAAWLENFERTLDSGDETAVATYFEAEGNWRDVLAFTWHLTPCVGASDIAKRLISRQPAVKACGFEISPTRTPPRRVKRLGRDCIEAIICFDTTVGHGEGVLRLTSARDDRGEHIHMA